MAAKTHSAVGWVEERNPVSIADLLGFREAPTQPKTSDRGLLMANGKFTEYYRYTQQWPDRIVTKIEWIKQVVLNPDAEIKQPDGRIRLWAKIVEADGRYLRVILLDDGETVHNAFFDRNFKP